MPFNNSCASVSTLCLFLFPIAWGSPSTTPKEGVRVVACLEAASQATYKILLSRKALARLAMYRGRAEQGHQCCDPVQGTCPSPGPSASLGHLREELDAASAPSNPAQGHVLGQLGPFYWIFLSDHPGHETFSVTEETGMMKCKYFTT